MTHTGAKEIPDLLLERLALGEVSSEERAALAARGENDPVLRARLGELDRSNAQILAAYPPDQGVAEIQRRLHAAKVADRMAVTPRRRSTAWGLAVGLPAFGALSVAIALVVGRPEVSQRKLQSPEIGIALKGGPQLVVHRQHGSAQEVLASGDEAQGGDVLQLSFRVAAETFVAVLSIDGRGRVTMHYPDRDQAAWQDTGDLITLAHAYELDDAPEAERFFLVASPRVFSVQLAAGAARALSHISGGLTDEHQLLRLPAGFSQTSVIILKAGRSL